MHIGFGPQLRNKGRLAAGDRVDGRLRESLRSDPPLLGEEGLDDRSRSIATTARHLIVDNFAEKALIAEIANNGLARLGDCHSAVGLGRGLDDAAAPVDDRQGLEPAAPATLKVVEVVPRRHLHRARSKFGIDEAVGDDGNLPARQRHAHLLADELPVALVVGVNGDAGVAEHGLRPGCRDRDPAIAADDRILQLPQLPRLIDVFDLEVGDRREAVAAPVDETVGAVDEALAVELDEDFPHRPRGARIHREGGA